MASATCEGAYPSAFSVDALRALSQEEQGKHTLGECKTCGEKFAALSNAFPLPKRIRKKPAQNGSHNNIYEQDLSTPRALGRKALKELENISQERFQRPGYDVLIETPRSRLVQEPTSAEQRRNKRKFENNITYAIK